MSYKRSYKRKHYAPENNTREHSSQTGFSWTLKMPDRTASSLSGRKPTAIISCDGYDDLHIPVAVAKALDADDAPESKSHAELLYNIRETSDKLAYQKVIDLVSRREYSSVEAQDKLRLYGYSSACAERVVARAQEARIINDARFTESFIRSKVYAGWGPVRISRELSARGVDSSELEGWPDAYYEGTTIAERAAELLATKSIPPKNAYAKLVRFLVTRGYPMSIAKDAVAERLNEPYN